MKYLISLFTISCLLLSEVSYAQTNKRFTKEGSVEFEKTVNMFALIAKTINKENESFMQQAFDAYKKSKPQFVKLKSTLTFGNNQTLFAPVANNESAEGAFGDNPMVGQNNITYTNLSTNTSATQKTVFEEKFLVKDTVRKIKWKITDEVRDIAGYSCRRANALIMDSVYVVAFYTDEIPVSGGPESFTGLPGMILGVALPHENITWFATKVTDQTIAANIIKPPVKGKPVDNKQLQATFKSVMKDWGNYSQIALKAFLL
ncbi:GLPGLI family protein [Mucilaginibacter robiniae]|uniref:GLPGLI family protein n=1 Tax=Mucilaginibacter robiniae TaxID=2728022 RepID=A0A7L5E4X1_9SPHI|nr:GLPGLI family protein [Mucilaginibacter robiniae]QJD98105.1 GLPGLI family protein [Mucilaginibacter robiniae]